MGFLSFPFEFNAFSSPFLKKRKKKKLSFKHVMGSVYLQWTLIEKACDFTLMPS